MSGRCKEVMEVYTRVVGYYRPTTCFNKGKIAEFNMRKTFDLSKIPQTEIQDQENNKSIFTSDSQ